MTPDALIEGLLAITVLAGTIISAALFADALELKRTLRESGRNGIYKIMVDGIFRGEVLRVASQACLAFMVVCLLALPPRHLGDDSLVFWSKAGLLSALLLLQALSVESWRVRRRVREEFLLRERNKREQAS